MTKRKSYAELSRNFNIFLFNKINEIDDEYYYEGLRNGTTDYCYVHDDCDREQDDCEFEHRDIYQTYLIDEHSAKYLIDATDEIVFYSEKLDEYLWGVTHWGTSWDGVYLDVKEYNIETDKWE